MTNRALGDASVTAIGIGDVDLAFAGARGLTFSDVERAVHEALELGITLVDVTDDDQAERLVGDVVRALRLRDRAIVVTRMRALTEKINPGRDPLSERLPPRYVQERVEASLRATKLDVLPLAMLPLRTAWCRSRAWPELLGTCARLVREGKVMRWGVRLDLVAAEHDDRLADELVEAAALRDPFIALSVVYNACDRRAAPLFDGSLVVKAEPAPGGDLLGAPSDRLVAAAIAGGASDPLVSILAGELLTRPADAPPAEPPKPLPVLAREPLAGVLGGAIGPGVKLTPRDDRNEIDDATLVRIATGIARLATLVRHEPPAARSCAAARAAFESAPKTDREAATVAELALRYVLDRAIALPRLHRRQHIPEALALAYAPPLTAELRARIEHALDVG